MVISQHVKGLMNITASSDSYNMCHQVVDYGWNNFWSINNTANSWIQFDFKDFQVSPQSYTIKSNGHDYHHLLSWKIEGSNDASSWLPIHSNSSNDLNGMYITKHFTCSRTYNEFFRYIRLTQTGKNSSRCDHLQMSEIEFFGIVKSRI